MVAAFIWWYVALVQQNDLLTATKIETLTARGVIDQAQIASIEDFATRKTKQYIGEGLTFIAISFGCHLCLPFIIEAIKILDFTTKFHDGGHT
jgi:hypothetical protein